MNQQQLLLKQELTVSQILRIYGKQFTQVQTQYSDGHNGRCALGVIMSYFGWDGTDDYSGYTLDEIADHLDRASGISR
jgi:hypothetical protein